MKNGGKRPGAGRPKGSKNKPKPETILAHNAGLTPLEYMLSVFRDTTLPETLRLDAAAKAAPYVHAKLASVEHKGSMELRRASELTDDELLSIALAAPGASMSDGSGALTVLPLDYVPHRHDTEH